MSSGSYLLKKRDPAKLNNTSVGNCAIGLEYQNKRHRDISRDSMLRLPRSRRDCYRLFSCQNKTFDFLLWREKYYRFWLNPGQSNR